MERSEPGRNGSAETPAAEPQTLRDAISRFGLLPADLVELLPASDREEPDADDPAQAIGRSVARVDVEEHFATAYLTLDDGSYLAFASRIDEEGVILLDRFCEPAGSYDEYWAFEELEGESGPPPAEDAPQTGSPYDPEAWRGAAGRTIVDLGWYDEGMQVFVHFAEGGYLTLAARAAGGVAYLLGYFVAEVEPEGYLMFDLPPDEDED